VLGNEFAGEVEAVGRGVTSFTVGDRVFGFEGSRFGAHAEYLAVPEDGFLATVPAGLTYEEVAPSTEGSLYAQTLIGSAKVRRGYDVLVNGATGAISSAAVQLLHGLGARVTAVRHGDHADLVRGLGAHRVIDYTAQDFITDDQTYDVVLDAVGKSSFGRCCGPRAVPLDGPGPAVPESRPAPGHAAARREEGQVPDPRTPDRERVRQFQELLASGAFRPLVDRTYPLDEIVEAYRYVETGQKLGSVVISVRPPDR
jgi:NADPH:quinone reductase-like Zn-dependent oxidoreductase